MRQIEREFRLSADAVGSGPASIGSTTSSSLRLLEVERHMEALLQVSLASSASLDPEAQSRGAVDELVRVFGAERGFLFWLDPAAPSGMRLLAARDGDKHDLPPMTGFSSTVVGKVRDGGAPLVVTGTEEGEVLGSESAVAMQLRSSVAAPLMVRSQLVGVLYLDSRLAKGLFTEEHLKVLVPICNHVAIALRVSESARIEAQHLALQKELALTAAVQSLFLPKEPSARVGKLDLAGVYRPAAQCAGDWWQWSREGDRALRVLVGDVTGHGAASAMVTASVATAVQVLRDRGDDRDIPRLLGAVNLTVERTAARMTMSVLEIDLAGSMLSWWTAGAPPLFILGRDGNVEVLRGKGTLLGTTPFSASAKQRPLASGDRLFVFTDGVYELMTPGDRQLGLRRLQTILKRTRALDASAAATDIGVQLDDARKGIPADDDITFVVVDVALRNAFSNARRAIASPSSASTIPSSAVTMFEGTASSDASRATAARSLSWYTPSARENTIASCSTLRWKPIWTMAGT
jgi:serine phosphatase RsbU (regulator of sigma subunit)